MKYRENFKLAYQNKPSYQIDEENKSVKCHLTVKVITPDSLFANKIMDTTVITANGYAKCDDMDKFNHEVGKRIALARAESLAYHKAEVIIRNCAYDALKFIVASDKFEDKSNFVQVHNKQYIAKNFGPCPQIKKDVKCCEKKNDSYKNQPRDSMGRFMPKEEVKPCVNKTVGQPCCNKEKKGITLNVHRNYSKK